MSKSRIIGITTACVGCLLAVVLAGCGGSSSGTGSGTSSSGSTTAASGGAAGSAHHHLTTVNVGILGDSANAPLWLGMKKGYFKDEGLKLVLHTEGHGGAAFVPALVNDSLDITSGGAVGIVEAIAKGLDVKILGHNGAPVPSQDDATSVKDTTHLTTAIAVRKDSGITSLEDLKGKTAAAITITGVEYLCVEQALAAAHVDPKAVKILEMPLPDMLPALHSGRIDAAALIEPFITQAKAAGDRVLSYPCVTAMPGDPIAIYGVSGKWAKENPDLVRKFTTALMRANRYDSAHPEAERKVTEANTDIPASVAEKMGVSATAGANGQPNSLKPLVTLMLKYGLVNTKPDLSDAFTG